MSKANELHAKRVQRANRYAWASKETQSPRKAKRATHILRVVFLDLERIGFSRKGSGRFIQRRMKRYIRDTMKPVPPRPKSRPFNGVQVSMP